MFKQVDYVMVVVSDMPRSVRFYRDTLGLPLKFESKEWTEFQTGTTTLALHGGGNAEAGPLRGSGRGGRGEKTRVIFMNLPVYPPRQHVGESVGGGCPTCRTPCRTPGGYFAGRFVGGFESRI